MELLTNHRGKLLNDPAIFDIWNGFSEKYPDVAGQMVVAEDCGDYLQVFGGIDYALDNRKPELPLAVFSLVPLYVAAKQNFRKLMLLLSQPKTMFVDALTGPNPFESRDKLVELVVKIGNRTGNQAGLAYFGRQQWQDDLGTIEHGINCPERLAKPSNCARAASDGRSKLGFTGSDEEVINQIITARKNQVKDVRLAGQNFAGIFCDVQNTLLLSDDKTLNLPVYNWLKEQETKGVCITIWTGGKPAEMAYRLYSTDQFQEDLIQWPVVAKSAFSGATVEIAVDDQVNSLKDDYGIEVGQLLSLTDIVS